MNTQEDKVIVRLRTTMWADDKGIYAKKSLTYLKRKCIGFNVAQNDIDDFGIEFVVPLINNLYTVKDGVYELRMCNISTDWETGFVDDYEYKLVPTN